MKLALTHRFSFSVGTPSRAVEHVLLTPLTTPQQKVERWSIEMPGFAEAAVFRDGFGNRAHLVSQHRPDADIDVMVTGAVETFDRAGVLGRLEFDPPPALFRRQAAKLKPAPSLVDGLKDGPDRIALFHELMRRTHEGRGAPDQAQSQGDGGHSQSQDAGALAAADLAKAFVVASRSLGIPARFVTGYLLDDDGQARRHDWAEAWDERLGWIGFDPALNLCPTETHIRLASALDATGAMPIRAVPAIPAITGETVEIVAQDEA